MLECLDLDFEEKFLKMRTYMRYRGMRELVKRRGEIEGSYRRGDREKQFFTKHLRVVLKKKILDKTTSNNYFSHWR